MKFDWKNWNVGGKIMFVMGCVAILSMFMSWVDVGFIAQSGMSQLMFFLLVFWVYPLLMLFKNNSINRIWGLASSLASVLATIMYIGSKTIEISGNTVNVAATGAYLFLFASIGLIVGVLKYAPTQTNTNDAI